MKKIISIILVLVMTFALGATAMAADNGSITITNATVNQTYNIYKIFDASIKMNDDNSDAEAVSYSIQKDSQFFSKLFGTDGTTENDYFIYNANTGNVVKRDKVNDSELTKYLTDIIEKGSYTPETAAIKATAETVKFEGIPYGYYVITSSLGTTVTINSNTPDVEVIDKNQEPASDLDKKVQNGVDENGAPVWAESNSANIGDEITYKVSFTATNYDGDKKIKYYQVHDDKGDAIWVEFNKIRVSVGGKELTKGYYLSQGGNNTDNWEFFGTWEGVEPAERDRQDAEWYLVHIGYDKFRITIPWLEEHTLTEVKDAEGNITSYNLEFQENAASKYDSPTEVVVTYTATVEPGAAIGSTSHGNRFNKASASWISENETGTTPPDEVVTYVYGIGLLKDDGSTGKNLSGAKFRIYRDKECTIPVYVIPTDIAGVYIVDSYGTPGETISGLKKDTARKTYEKYLEAYLGDNVQDNYVVSQVNGKLAILGLAAGSYFLKEVEAPSGYNALTLPIEIVAGEGTRPFIIFADDEGNVADIQSEDGVHTEKTYDLTHTVVHNSKGLELPSTGGQGKLWIMTIGTVLAIGFAVFLITNKKMSIYND